MKLKTKFFDSHIVQKDLIRFCPSWILYLVAALLVEFTLIPLLRMDGYLPTAVDTLNVLIVVLAVVNIVYGFLNAQLLFGDLFKSSLCNALHAMPLRRENWFFSHITAGLLMSLAPNLLVTVIVLPVLGSFWYAGLLWLLAVTMEYLFFFGLAVFCMHVTGNRFAALLVYGIINFLSMLALWFVKSVYEPMFYGISIQTDPFYFLCPIVQLCSGYQYMDLYHLDSCPCIGHEYKNGYPHQYAFHMPGGWGYLAVLAVIGLVFLGVALVMYRRRKLERAGEFVVFWQLRPVFWVLFSLCAGASLQIFAAALWGSNDKVSQYIFLAIGILIGFYVGQMLLMRTIKVFQRKNLLQLLALYGLMLLSLVVCWLDPVGITRYVPDAAKVESVVLAPNHVSDNQIERYQQENYRPNSWLELSSPALIEEACRIHSMMIEEGEATDYRYGLQYYTIFYTMTDGSTLARRYTVYNANPANQAVQALREDPTIYLGASSVEQLKKEMSYLTLDGMDIPQKYNDSLLEALWKDCQAGYTAGLHNHSHSGESTSLQMVKAGDKKISLMIYSCCPDTCQELSRILFEMSMERNNELLLRYFRAADIGGMMVDENDYEILYELYSAVLYDVRQLGYSSQKKPDCQELTLWFLGGAGHLSVYIPIAEGSALDAWQNHHADKLTD